jgi:hypothetical protein
MIFTNRKQSFINVNITIQNEKVSQEKSMKYLGVTQGCRKRGAGLEPYNFHLYKQNTQKN